MEQFVEEYGISLILLMLGGGVLRAFVTFMSYL